MTDRISNKKSPSWLLILSSEALFLLTVSAIAAILLTGGFHFEWWDIDFRFHSLENPFTFLMIFFIAHLWFSGGHLFPFSRLVLRSIEGLLSKIDYRLSSVHWSLKGSLLVVVLGILLLHIDRSPAPGIRREMIAPRKEVDLRLVTRDRKIDFPEPHLRRDFYKAGAMEITWKGHFFAPEHRTYAFAIEGDGFHSFTIAEKKVLEASPDWKIEQVEGETFLPYGSHPFEVTYGDLSYQSNIRLLWKEGETWEPVPATHLSGEPIAVRQFHQMQRRQQLRPFFIIACLILAWSLMLDLRRWWLTLSPAHRRKWTRATATTLILVGTILRLQFLIRSQAMTHADEAMVGLMSRHIAKAEAFPLIYYDQIYNGTTLAWLLAPVYGLFDLPFWNLKMATLLLSVLIAYLVYRVCRRWMGMGASLIALALTSVPPVMATVYGLMALVGPVEGVALDLLILLCVWPLLFSDKTLRWRYALFGLLCGISVWLNFQVFYYLAPIVLLFILQGPRKWKRLLLSVPAALLGMLPLLIFNIQRGWPTFRLFLELRAPKDYWEIFSEHLLKIGLPTILGGRVRWDFHRNFVPEPLPQIVALIFALALLVLVVSIIRRNNLQSDEQTKIQKLWRALWNLFLWFRSSPLGFLFLYFACALVLYLRSAFGEYYPRYLFSTFPMIAILLAWLVGKRMERFPRLAAACLIPLLLQNIIGNLKVDPFYFSQPLHYIYSGKFLPERNSELIELLRSEGIDSVYCDYWIGYTLALESGESITADTDRDRYPPYRERFLQSKRPAYVFHNHNGRIYHYRDVFERRLGWTEELALPYAVFVPPAEFIPRERWSAELKGGGRKQDLPEEWFEPQRAIDGDISFFSHWETWIESGQAQLTIDLGEVAPVGEVLLFRDWPPHEDAVGQGLVNGQLWTSQDGEQWQLQPSAEKDAHDHLDHFRLSGDSRARYLKIVNRPEAYPYRWTVYDVFVQS